MRRKNPREELIQQCSFANSEEELKSLAIEIREIFPKGLNRSTGTPNRQSPKELCDALLRFEEHFEMEATKEEILEATTKYVTDKQGSAYRQCSKYFIIKDLSREGKGITSTLATYIEMLRDGEASSTGEVFNFFKDCD